MKARVTEEGLLVPRDLLRTIPLEKGAEVEIREEPGRLLILPATREDPVLGLGENPVRGGASDASERHDRYLYGSP